MSPRKKVNSSRVNLTISFIFHGVLVVAIMFFAAKEGYLGKKLKTLTVQLVQKEKKLEPVKEKAPEPKVEQPKVAEATHPAAVPTPTATAPVAAPPPAADAVAVAPAAVDVPSFEFGDGAHPVATGDAKTVYKGMVERTLRSRWNRPEGIDDSEFVVEVELSVDAAGQVGPYRWVKGSGNTAWDDSVKSVLASTKTITRPPPKGFPPSFKVRFDVESARTEEINLSLR